MKNITDMLDADSRKNWFNIQNELKEMEARDDKLRELGEIMSRMLQEFSDSYDTYNQAPPGIKETLDVMLPLSLCKNEGDLNNTLANNDFWSNLQSATTQVDSVQSGLNYVKGGLRFIAALVLTLVVAPLVFLLNAALGLTIGFAIPVPLAGALILTPLASIPTFYTYKAGKDLLMTGINQIQRTQHENGNEGKIVQQMGLFRDKLGKRPDDLNPIVEEPLVARA